MASKSSIQTIWDLMQPDWHQRQTDDDSFNNAAQNTISSKVSSLTPEEIRSLFDKARKEITNNQLKFTEKNKYPRNPQFIVNYIFEPEDKANSPKMRANLKAYLESNLQACCEYFEWLVKSESFYDGFRSSTFTQNQVEQALFHTWRLLKQCECEWNISTNLFNANFHSQSRTDTTDSFWMAKNLFERGAIASPHRPADKAALVSVLTLRRLLESSFKRLLGFCYCYNPDNKILHEIKTYEIVEFIKEEIINGKIHTSWQSLARVDGELDVKNMGCEWGNLKTLIKIYEWCNIFIHQDMQRSPWQLFYALVCCSFLIRGGAVIENNVSKRSVYGWIKIIDYAQVKERFIERIKGKVRCRAVEFVFSEPEALLLGQP